MNKWLKIPLIMLVLLFACSVLLHLTIIVDRHQYADFSQFPTADALLTYLEKELGVGLTTRPQVEVFLQQTGISTCSGFDIEEGAELVNCRVLAPHSGAFITEYYYIVFIFEKRTILQHLRVEEISSIPGGQF